MSIDGDDAAEGGVLGGAASFKGPAEALELMAALGALLALLETMGAFLAPYLAQVGLLCRCFMGFYCPVLLLRCIVLFFIGVVLC